MWCSSQFRIRALMVCILLLVEVQPSPAQKISDYKVKAAYLYNFAKFVDWPPKQFPDAETPIRFCILNDHSFEIELNHLVKGKSIGGHRIDVIQVLDGEQARKCHVLFVALSQEQE